MTTSTNPNGEVATSAWTLPKPGGAPRVTVADIEAAIASEHYFTGFDGFIGAALANIAQKPEAPADTAPPEALKSLTFCILVMRNGFTVTGESACVSAANFNAEVGRQIARENAIDKLWPLMGFALKSSLAQAAPADAPIAA